MWARTNEHGWINLDYAAQVFRSRDQGDPEETWCVEMVQPGGALIKVVGPDAAAVREALDRGVVVYHNLSIADRENLRNLERALRNMPRSMRVGY